MSHVFLPINPLVTPADFSAKPQSLLAAISATPQSLRAVQATAEQTAKATSGDADAHLALLRLPASRRDWQSLYRFNTFRGGRGTVSRQALTQVYGPDSSGDGQFGIRNVRTRVRLDRTVFGLRTDKPEHRSVRLRNISGDPLDCRMENLRIASSEDTPVPRSERQKTVELLPGYDEALRLRLFIAPTLREVLQDPIAGQRVTPEMVSFIIRTVERHWSTLSIREIQIALKETDEVGFTIPAPLLSKILLGHALRLPDAESQEIYARLAFKRDRLALRWLRSVSKNERGDLEFATRFVESGGFAARAAGSRPAPDVPLRDTA